MSEEQTQNQNTMGASPLSGMLEGLLSNPEMLKRIGSIIGAMSSAQPSTPAPDPSVQVAVQDTSAVEETAESSAPEATPASASGINFMGGDGLASLLTDPSMLEKLPQIIAVMKPLMASMPPPKPSPPSHSSSPPSHSSSPQDCRDNLLLALKPFLSPERRDAVDSIIRISKLGTVFKQLK